MEIKCSHTDVLDTDLLVPNPRNPNKHPEEQIKLLAKIMAHQGWRSPIVVSRRSGYVVKGHGRLEAAKLNGWDKCPVDKQDYVNEADEWADMIADNKIAELAESDMKMIQELAQEIPQPFDLDLLGIPNFQLTALENIISDASSEWVGMPEFNQEDQLAHRQVIVNFKSDEDVMLFAKLLEQDLTDKTRSIWYPKVDPICAVDKRYSNEHI